MIITFSWPAAQLYEKSAVAIAQLLSISGRLGSLKVLEAAIGGNDGLLKDSEVLFMEVRGLSNNLYMMPILGVYNIPIWQKVEDVVEMLREYTGVEPRVLINGDTSVLAYAAEEEARARYFRETLEVVREALKATRTWLRDPRIASMRQRIDRCFEKESDVVRFIGSRKELVFEDKK
ncbi:MAG: hypothetical protein G01um101477_467 [Candidatus Doudnabacteria bacterium Gr01-1014_77]|uniref:Uncharacterized protein n=1 Tax=Candidatus Doudnabacteria bacterium Gr01-1014_77 TaxID=2017133 RepID=A0A554JAV4_9BACT|nr:MAG: hypothetical protein G01um101477_467 [Candidatus Doudnabacteria bacterium Gr01-1014_77]